jgi:hypothetical protein
VAMEQGPAANAHNRSGGGDQSNVLLLPHFSVPERVGVRELVWVPGFTNLYN